MKNLFYILIFFLLGIWAFVIEPNMLQIRRYVIKDEDFSGLKVVLAGDFHIKTYGTKRLNRIVNLINAQNPDIVFSTGDFVSGYTEKSSLPIEEIAGALKNVKSKYGFYSVLGNHDWHYDGPRVTKTLRDNGIIVLENNNVPVEVDFKSGRKTVFVAGVEDLQMRTPDIEKALKGAEGPVILLTHTPDIFPDVKYPVNLTLAGHIHGGQVRIPFIGSIIIPSEYGDRYAKGLVEEEGRKIITTKGIGTSILPVRFHCPPEIVVIEFE